LIGAPGAPHRFGSHSFHQAGKGCLVLQSNLIGQE